MVHLYPAKFEGHCYRPTLKITGYKCSFLAYSCKLWSHIFLLPVSFFLYNGLCDLKCGLCSFFPSSKRIVVENPLPVVLSGTCSRYLRFFGCFASQSSLCCIRLWLLWSHKKNFSRCDWQITSRCIECMPAIKFIPTALWNFWTAESERAQSCAVNKIC